MLALACEKKENQVTPAPPVGPDPYPGVTARDCNVLQMEVSGGNAYALRFDAGNRLEGAELVYPKGKELYARRTFSLAYNDGNQLVSVVNNNFDSLNRQVNSVTYVYEYNDAKRLVSYYTNDDPSTRSRLIYGDDGKFLKLEQFNGNSLEYVYNAKGNVSRYIQMYADEPYKNVRVDLTSYDDQKNPFAGLGVAVLLMGFDPYSANNPLTATIAGLDARVLNSVSYTYTYNDKGYPATSKSVNTSVFDNIKAITENGTYQYVCN